MPRFFVTKAAVRDLLEIWAYIAEDNEAAADRLLYNFDEKFDLLATQPGLGRSRPELLPGLRSFPASSYVVFYLEDRDGVSIVRVLHSARDLGQIEFRPPGALN